MFASSAEMEDGDYTYTISGTEATITKYTGSDVSVSIPANIGEYKVTSVGNNAFKDCSEIVKVNIPKGIESIGNRAFLNCTSLKEISLPEGLKKVGYGFIANTAVTSLKIPKTVTYSGNYTGVGATGGALALEEVIFEEGISKIPDYFCSNESENKALIKVVIPESVTEIGSYAFYNCTGLERVSFGKNIKQVGNEAYRKCTGLKRIEFQENEEKVTEDDGTERLYPVCLGIRSFKDCTGIEEVVLSPNIKKIEKEAFSGCTALKQIEVPEGVEDIGDRVFSNCTNLKEISLPERLKNIGYGFIANTAVTSLKIPKTVTYSGNYTGVGATGGALALEEVIFEEGISKIPDYFCSNESENKILVKVMIPESVTEIGSYVFQNCTNVEIYGYEDSYANVYATENNFPFVSVGAGSKKLDVKVKFSDGNSKKELHWTKDGYSEKELLINIKVSGAYVHISNMDIELDDLKMFKVKEASKTTNIGNNYHYIVDVDKNITKNEAELCQISLVKKGWTWWKPNDKELHFGSISVTVSGEKPSGEIVKSTITLNSQLSLNYQNDIKVNETIAAEEKAAEEAEKQAESAAKSVANEFVDLRDKMILDPNIEQYLGHDQFEALKVLIYTEISLANISKSYFTAAGLPDKVAEKALEKFVGIKKSDFGIADKNVPIEVAVLGKNSKQYQFKFMCNVHVYSLKGSEFGISGEIATEMWEITNINKKKKKISCMPGIINEGKFKNFAEGVWKVAEASLKSAYKSVWGDDADKIANGIMKDSVDSLASKAAKYGLEKPVQIILKKYYEKKLKNKFSEEFFKLLIYPSKKIIVHCPVDVYIYNSDNKLVGSIENDIVTQCSDGIALWTEGDDKYIQLFGDSYRVVYKATGTGTMNVDIYDQMLNDYNYRNCEFVSVSLADGKEYSQTIDNVVMTDSGNYRLISNDGQILNVTNEQEKNTDIYPSEHSHVWDAGIEKEKATCTKGGIILYTCRECGEKREDEIKSKGHSWDFWKLKNAATVNNAEIWQRTCKTCNTVEKETRGKKLASKMKVSATDLKLQIKQKTKALKVYDIQKGDFVSSVRSSNTKLVKVSSFTKTGEITLVAQKRTGKAKIAIVLAGGARKNISVTVQKGIVRTTKINGLPKNISLKKGSRVLLKPVLVPVTSKEKITYSSSNKKIVTVSKKGEVLAKKKGKARITVKSGKRKYSITIKVK